MDQGEESVSQGWEVGLEEDIKKNKGSEKGLSEIAQKLKLFEARISGLINGLAEHPVKEDRRGSGDDKQNEETEVENIILLESNAVVEGTTYQTGLSITSEFLLGSKDRCFEIVVNYQNDEGTISVELQTELFTWEHGTSDPVELDPAHVASLLKEADMSSYVSRQYGLDHPNNEEGRKRLFIEILSDMVQMLIDKHGDDFGIGFWEGDEMFELFGLERPQRRKKRKLTA